MSAEELRRRSVDKLSALREAGVEKILGQRHHPPSVGKMGDTVVTIPGSTIEGIGAATVELSAEIRALDTAIEVVNQVCRDMLSPPQEKSDTDVTETGEKQELYG